VLDTVKIQGRLVGPDELTQVRALLDTHPEWSRWRLSQEVCRLWDWRNGAGQWKDMAARTFLLKLAARGWVQLPPRRTLSPNRHRLAPDPARVWDQRPVVGELSDVRPLQLEEVSGQREGRAQVRAALARFHYLGWRAPVGENLQYTVRAASGRLLAVLVWGAAAWKCAARDRWLGWTREAREAHLSHIANNSRFLILPWVAVRHLASRILGRVARRIGADWEAKYGHRVRWLETFVERDRFAGTCYRAANWECVGTTTGRSRQDRARTCRVPVKDVYLYRLPSPAKAEVLR
jgi:hypothetical protein